MQIMEREYGIDEYAAMIDERLEASLPGSDGSAVSIREMMQYSLKGGGKRLRPLLCLEFCRLSGGFVRSALGFAAAVEFVHTYSLIHDDLPCMDDDDIRRGQPSSHKKFGEAQALLAGDALLTDAFALIARSALDGEVSDGAAVRAAGMLSRMAGSTGMVRGQYLDLLCGSGEPGRDELLLTDSLKCSCLIKAACTMGVLAAGGNAEYLKAADTFGENFGIAFQMTDDILDTAQDASCDGSGSNFVAILGPDGARRAAREYTDAALRALDVFGGSAEFLNNYALRILSR